MRTPWRCPIKKCKEIVCHAEEEVDAGEEKRKKDRISLVRKGVGKKGGGRQTGRETNARKMKNVEQ